MDKLAHAFSELNTARTYYMADMLKPIPLNELESLRKHNLSVIRIKAAELSIVAADMEQSND